MSAGSTAPEARQVGQGMIYDSLAHTPLTHTPLTHTLMPSSSTEAVSLIPMPFRTTLREPSPMTPLQATTWREGRHVHANEGTTGLVGAVQRFWGMETKKSPVPVPDPPDQRRRSRQWGRGLCRSLEPATRVRIYQEPFKRLV